MTDRTSQLSHAFHEVHAVFGNDLFGRRAESFARFFGTPRFLIGQTAMVVAWIAVNGLAVAYRWDPYPFILLNLAFSLQAAYAAPLILLAQTRQADRDKTMSAADTEHREALAAATISMLEEASQQSAELKELLDANTRLTQEIDRMSSEIHSSVVLPRSQG